MPMPHTLAAHYRNMPITRVLLYKITSIAFCCHCLKSKMSPCIYLSTPAEVELYSTVQHGTVQYTGVDSSKNEG